jgi:hypothetical protein
VHGAEHVHIAPEIQPKAAREAVGHDVDDQLGHTLRVVLLIAALSSPCASSATTQDARTSLGPISAHFVQRDGTVARHAAPARAASTLPGSLSHQ